MINRSPASSEENKTTGTVCKALKALSERGLSASGKTGHRSIAGLCDGPQPSSVTVNRSVESQCDDSRPSAVLVTERSAQPLAISNVRTTVARIKQTVKEDLQKSKEKLRICDDEVDQFESDYTRIRLWEKGILKSFPKGMLLSSPPGMGKTVFMQEIGNMIVEGDKKRIQFLTGADLIELDVDKFFSNARLSYKNTLNGSAPRKCFVYCIDEIDSAFVGRDKRSKTSEQEACRNTIQSIMDGGTELSVPNIYIIGTTNVEFKVFHEALLRPGRFGNQVTFDQKSSEQIQILIKLYLKSHPAINVEDRDIPLLSALYEGKTPAYIKEQIDKIATWSITEGLSISQEDGEQTVEKHTIPFSAFKKMLYPPSQINRNFDKEVEQLQRLHPYFPNLSYSSNQMKEALSLMTDIANRQEVGVCSIILLQGKAGSGKTAFLHELLQRFKAEDKECLVDHYSVITTVNLKNKGGIGSLNNAARHSSKCLLKARDHHSSIMVIDDGDWLNGKSFLPTSDVNYQSDPSIFVNEWNQTENARKKSNIILLVAINSETVLKKLVLPPRHKVTASEFMYATGLDGVIEGCIDLPETISEGDVEQFLGKFAVDDAGKIIQTLENEKLNIKQLMALIFSSRTRNGIIESCEFKKLLELNRKNSSERPLYYG